MTKPELKVNGTEEILEGAGLNPELSPAKTNVVKVVAIGAAALTAVGALVLGGIKFHNWRKARKAAKMDVQENNQE